MKRLSHRTKEADARTQYFRFNTPTGNTYIDMADHAKMDELATITSRWLADDDSTSYINDCAKPLAKAKP
jgi:hypothetical protein